MLHAQARTTFSAGSGSVCIIFWLIQGLITLQVNELLYSSKLSRDWLERNEGLVMSKWWHRNYREPGHFLTAWKEKQRVKRAKFISAISQKIRRLASVPNLVLRMYNKWRGKEAVWSLKHFTFGSFGESSKPWKLTQLLQHMALLSGFCALLAFLLLLSHEYWDSMPAFHLDQNSKAGLDRAFKWQPLFCWQLGLTS